MKKATLIFLTTLFLIGTAQFGVGLAQRPRKRPFVQKQRLMPSDTPMLGFRIGNDFEADQILLGAQLWLPVGTFWKVVPNFDYYFVDDPAPFDRWQFNGDLIFKPRPMGALYFGGGLAVNYLIPNKGDSQVYYGANALVGFNLNRRGPTQFYIQTRWSFFESTHFSALCGANLVLK